MTFGRVLRTGLLGKARALLHGLGPKGEHPSRDGYWVISYFRWARVGGPLTEYEERDRRWYRWKWRANMAARPRLFMAKVGPGEYGLILTRVEPGPR